MFKNTDKKAQRLFGFVAAIFAVFLVFNGAEVFAVSKTFDGVTVSTDDWRNTSTGLGENSVYVFADQISLDNQNLIEERLDDIFAIVDERHYTVAEMQNGTYESERSTKYTFGSNNSGYNKTLVLTKTATPDSPTDYIWSDKKAIFRWPNAAKDIDGNLYDVTMTISDVEGRVSENGNVGYNKAGVQLFQGRSHKSSNTLQKYSLSQLDYNPSGYYAVNGSTYWSDGVSYTTTIKLYKAGTNELIDADKSAMAMSFKDIDVRDKTDTGGGTLKSFWQFKGNDSWNIPSKTNSSNNLTLNSGYDGSDAERYFADNTTSDPSLGSPNKYTESIGIIDGLKEQKIFSWNTNSNVGGRTAEGNYVYYSRANGNLTASATRATGGTGEPSDKSSSFVLLADARGFSYRWAGSDCGTVVGFIGPSKVVTATVGQYANRLTITSTDYDVLWRENKEITITVEGGYSLETITVDGSVIPLSDLTFVSSDSNGNRTYSYTFNDVVEDHEITVSAQPIQFNIQKLDGNGNIVPGASLMLSGEEEFLHHPEVTENIDPSLNPDTIGKDKVTWTTTSSLSTAVVTALPAQQYCISEEVTPSGYIKAGDICFTVGAWTESGVSHYGIISATPASAKVDDFTIKMLDQQTQFANVTFTKIVKGAGGDTNKEFYMNYLLDCGGIDTSAIELDYTKTYRGVSTPGTGIVVNSAMSFSLRHDETIVISTPAVCTITITEDDYSSDGYTTTYSPSNTGRTYNPMSHYPQNVAITITNTKDAPIITGVDRDIDAIPFITSGALIATAGIYLVGRARRLKT